LILSNIVKIVATRYLLMQKCTKFDFGWGSAPDPVGTAHSAPPDILVESNMQGLLFRGWKRTRTEKREQDGREATRREKQYEIPNKRLKKGERTEKGG